MTMAFFLMGSISWSPRGMLRRTSSAPTENLRSSPRKERCYLMTPCVTMRCTGACPTAAGVQPSALSAALSQQLPHNGYLVSNELAAFRSLSQRAGGRQLRRRRLRRSPCHRRRPGQILLCRRVHLVLSPNGQLHPAHASRKLRPSLALRKDDPASDSPTGSCGA